MKNRAFTLIELLVVIAIIAILAAILFPVFAQAKVAAKKASDLSSVKQTALAQMMYSADADDLFPTQNPDANGFPQPWNAGSQYTFPQVLPAVVHPLGYMTPELPQAWAREIQPYMKSLQLMVSVAAPKATDPGYGYKNGAGAGNSTWMMNGVAIGVSQTAMSAPADTVLLQGATVTTCESLVQPTFIDTHHVCNGIDVNIAGNTFGKGANYGWADGHASYKRRDAITWRNMGMAGIVHRHSRSGWSDVPNTTTLTDPALNDGFWDSWGECGADRL
jgi:prepilin-type N-terminal cleavage/methylation domain-containing protein/prepilin-type processing-associated H-X9-DG protein